MLWLGVGVWRSPLQGVDSRQIYFIVDGGMKLNIIWKCMCIIKVNVVGVLSSENDFGTKIGYEILIPWNIYIQTWSGPAYNHYIRRRTLCAHNACPLVPVSVFTWYWCRWVISKTPMFTFGWRARLQLKLTLLRNISNYQDRYEKLYAAYHCHFLSDRA